MAASQPRFGIQHLTVVPTNFEPEADDMSNQTTAETADNEADDDVNNQTPVDENAVEHR